MCFVLTKLVLTHKLTAVISVLLKTVLYHNTTFDASHK